MKRKIFTSLLASTLVISSIAFVPNIETAKAYSLKDIRAKKKETQRELSSVKNKKAQVQKDIEKIDSEMQQTTNKIVKNQEQIKKNKEKIKKLEAEIKELEIRIAERDELLKERVRSMHVNGGAINYVDVLLGSKSFGDFLDRVLALNLIAEQDRAIIEEQKADKRALEENKAEVEKLIAKIEKEVKQLQELKKELNAKLSEKEKLLSQIKHEEDALHTELKGYIAEEKAMEEKLRRAQERANRASGSSVTYRKSNGMFLWPTGGRLSSGYGWRVHPISGKRKLHKGLDIANAHGTPIRAAAAGTVIHASSGWNGGYGTSIKIDHGNGYVTHYAHLSSLSVKVGQKVSAGQVIGRMGSTGSSTGSHLHFEVYKNGSTVDPLDFL